MTYIQVWRNGLLNVVGSRLMGRTSIVKDYVHLSQANDVWFWIYVLGLSKWVGACTSMTTTL